MANQQAALDAVGNPTRREVLRLLRHGERTVRQMTDELPVTQGAVSQHLRVLHDAGLVTVRAEGTRRLYSVDLGGLASVRAWVDSFWDDVLTAFVDHAERRPTDRAPLVDRAPPTDSAPPTNTARPTDDLDPEPDPPIDDQEIR